MTPQDLSHAIAAALERLALRGEVPVGAAGIAGDLLQRPPSPGPGDYASTAPLRLASRAGLPAREVAARLAAELHGTPGIASLSVAGPGFLNIGVEPASAGAATAVLRLRTSLAEHAGPLPCGPRAGAPAGVDPAGVDPGDATSLNRWRRVAAGQAVGRLLAAAGAGEAGAVVADRVGHTSARPEADAVELIRLLGPDALRFGLLRHPVEADLVLDVAELTRADRHNPVYAVQHAHARSVGLRHHAAALGVVPDDEPDGPGEVAALSGRAADELLRLLLDHPTVLRSAAARRAPHLVARHLERVADRLDRFLAGTQVLPVGPERPGPSHRHRIHLVAATGTLLAQGLALLGVSAPERM